MKDYKYQLVLQFAASDATAFDQLVSFEERLPSHLRGLAEVDGHDFGLGEYNLFIHSDEPEQTYQVVESLRRSELPTRIATAAYRDFCEDEYIVLYPPGTTNFRIA